MKLDLDARRKARAEQRAKDGIEPNSITLGKIEYSLPNEFPLSAVEPLMRSDIAGALAELLGSPAEADALIGAGMTLPDLLDIMREMYGTDMGKLGA